MLRLELDNPAPFAQPFLELVLAGSEAKNIFPDGSMILIDVNGEIEKYIREDYQPTERLVELCKAFAKAGVVVTSFNQYAGSGGPHIVMRHGVLFYRMMAIEDPPKEVFAYEYREPTYRGLRRTSEE